ncbi:hypothetical protein RI129_010731 [Pyrocoelia pectoralis]|uniref:UDP-glucuronosyltransferase n=1 Tax=Pyrocoelia pectoralis TaxID=417401 RepID=A0AAN7Z906_9COLE
MLIAWLFSFFAMTHNGNTARILCIAPVPSYSHQIVYQPLWRELSLRGHQVTTLTTDPIKDPKLINLTEIDLHFSYETWNKGIMGSILNYGQNVIGLFFNIMQQLFDVYDEQLRHPSFQALIHGDDQFDAVIVEAGMPPMLAFAVKYKCPLINILSVDAGAGIHQIMGNPTHPALYPEIYYAFDEQLTFFQRLGSFLSIYLGIVIGIQPYIVTNNMVQKYFGSNYPPLYEIMYNISMLFLNTDPVLHRIRPSVPTVVQIGGGLHIKAPTPLPSDLQTLLDGASQVFIYFSLGSNVKSKDIPIEIRTKILETFAQLPYQVVWKFEADELPNKPENVFISKWLPQQDVLRHPNVKLFVTQGGLQSMEEAIYSGVPMVVMPFFADQGANGKKIVYKGMGLEVDYTNFDKEELRGKILNVIQNPRYRNKVKELAKLVLDQPMTGLERAVWWTEYVIRHKGAPHLKSPLKDYPWYQYLLLDVMAVLIISFIILVCMIYLTIRTLWRCFKPKPKCQEKKRK